LVYELNQCCVDALPIVKVAIQIHFTLNNRHFTFQVVKQHLSSLRVLIARPALLVWVTSEWRVLAPVATGGSH